MKQKSFISVYSLLVGVCGVMAVPYVASAGIRIGNMSRSYADSHAQVNGYAMGSANGQQATSANTQTTTSSDVGTTTATDPAGAIVNLPVRVASMDSAKRFAAGERVGAATLETLEQCARIYPGGDFAWDTPTAGLGAGGAHTCIATIEMRVVNGDGRGNDLTVARANVAAGGTIRCNISDFPESGYTADAAKVVFPADTEPTHQDVIQIMNEEQKQNAGIKIAAGAIIGGLGGNIAGKAERGSDSLIGMGQDKMKTTAIGALTGAALMAGNTYAGKVGGDVILSTGVNAAAGGAIGNMMASGNSVLRIEKCDVDGAKTCLWGTAVKTDEFKIGEVEEDGKTKTVTVYYGITTKDTYKCTQTDDKTACERANNLVPKKFEGGKTLAELTKDGFHSIDNNKKYYYNKTKKIIDQDESTSDGSVYIEVTEVVQESGSPVRAMVVGVSDKTFGFTMSDWEAFKLKNEKTAKIVGRDNNGNVINLDGNYTLDEFRPQVVNAEDGGLIDINNKARTKSTLTGAGIGGAMGGFTAYQGAQSDIEERWQSAVREYKDSLTRIYCITGQRYLSQYNDQITIPGLNLEQ